MNQISTQICLIGDLGNEFTRNDLLLALLKCGMASFIKMQSLSLCSRVLPDALKPFVETWSYHGEKSDLNIRNEIIKVYPFFYQDVLDNKKYSHYFDIKVPRERVFRKYIGNFREKAELIDICTAVILKTPVLVYSNMRDNLKLFSPEYQLKFRRYNIPFLTPLYQRELKTSENLIYKVKAYEMNMDIPMYPLFSEWLKKRMTATLQIIFIEKAN